MFSLRSADIHEKAGDILGGLSFKSPVEKNTRFSRLRITASILTTVNGLIGVSTLGNIINIWSFKGVTFPNF